MNRGRCGDYHKDSELHFELLIDSLEQTNTSKDRTGGTNYQNTR